jgi:acyl-CoA synthetase (AMP-forming)/AMP-acid ligase II
MILRGGANVYPAEVERVMVDHPGVREVAVFGIPDERLGELVAAGLVAEAGPWASGDPDLLVEDVRSFCRERLAHYKVPDRMLVLDVLPRNAMGKVIKDDLVPAFDAD